MTSQTSGDLSDPQGPNSWFIQELYQQYLDNPRSVPQEWQDIFAQGPPGTVAANPPAEGRTVRLDEVDDVDRADRQPTRLVASQSPGFGVGEGDATGGATEHGLGDR